VNNTMNMNLESFPRKGIAHFSFIRIGILFLILFLFPGAASGRIYIDVNAPSIPKFNIAIPDFKNLGKDKKHFDLSTKMPGVLSNDLDLSGYFNPMDKEAFLAEKGGA